MKHISLLHQRVPVYLLVSLICQLDDFTAQWEINGLTRLNLPRDGFTGGGGGGGWGAGGGGAIFHDKAKNY